jgi:hypothetical protein
MMMSCKLKASISPQNADYYFPHLNPPFFSFPFFVSRHHAPKSRRAPLFPRGEWPAYILIFDYEQQIAER